jgi:hypothetical protein
MQSTRARPLEDQQRPPPGGGAPQFGNLVFVMFACVYDVLHVLNTAERLGWGVPQRIIHT